MNKNAKTKPRLAPLSDELIESGEDLSGYMRNARAVPAASLSPNAREAIAQGKMTARRKRIAGKKHKVPVPTNVIDLVSVLQESLQRHGRSRAKRAAWAELLAEAAALKERFSQFESLLHRVTDSSSPSRKSERARR